MIDGLIGFALGAVVGYYAPALVERVIAYIKSYFSE